MIVIGVVRKKLTLVTLLTYGKFPCIFKVLTVIYVGIINFIGILGTPEVQRIINYFQVLVENGIA